MRQYKHTPEFKNGYEAGYRDVRTLPRKLRVFLDKDPDLQDWIEGYKFGFADAARSGGYFDKDRIRHGIPSRIDREVEIIHSRRY